MGVGPHASGRGWGPPAAKKMLIESADQPLSTKKGGPNISRVPQARTSLRTAVRDAEPRT